MPSVIGRKRPPNPNAGRKPGSKNTRTKEVALAAAAKGITPIEVILQIMRRAHKSWVANPEDTAMMSAAVLAAEKAAPYIHPRLASVESHVEGTLGTYVAVPVSERDPIPAVDAATGAADTCH